jgi:hypothetical protein
VVPSDADSISTGAPAGPEISASMATPFESMTGIQFFLQEFLRSSISPLIPAKAGIQLLSYAEKRFWVPAFAGTSGARR